jgi:hypothetical protein
MMKLKRDSAGSISPVGGLWAGDRRNKRGNWAIINLTRERDA